MPIEFLCAHNNFSLGVAGENITNATQYGYPFFVTYQFRQKERGTQQGIAQCPEMERTISCSEG